MTHFSTSVSLCSVVQRGVVTLGVGGRVGVDVAWWRGVTWRGVA